MRTVEFRFNPALFSLAYFIFRAQCAERGVCDLRYSISFYKPRMGTFICLVVTLLLSAAAQRSSGECLQQPVVSQLFPPSGTIGRDSLGSTVYTITGQFLTDSVVTVVSEQGLFRGVSYLSRNDSSISFHIGTTFSDTVAGRTDARVVVAPVEVNCSEIDLPVLLFQRGTKMLGIASKILLQISLYYLVYNKPLMSPLVFSLVISFSIKQ